MNPYIVHHLKTNFFLLRAKDSVKLNNTINRLKIILYYSFSLNTYECLLCQIYQ